MNNHPAKKRLVIADDHPMVREWFTQMINREPDLTVCGEAANAAQTLQAIEKLHPDMALVDLAMDGSHGTDLIKSIATRHPQLPVLVVSMHEESLYAERALHAGAHGYITKSEVGEKIREAIRRVLAGGIYVSETIAARILQRTTGPAAVSSPLDKLSDRELEVYRLLGAGYGPSQIAAELQVSVKCVEVYMARLREKLSLKDARELHQHAIQHHVLNGSMPSAPKPAHGSSHSPPPG
jgi:DNA-binding NarL/FixJ family response regulator